MDLATLLMRVDCRNYATLSAYMADLQAIVTATQQYWAGDPRGAREVCAEFQETCAARLLGFVRVEAAGRLLAATSDAADPPCDMKAAGDMYLCARP